jgi:serine/threonine-protein kinase
MPLPPETQDASHPGFAQTVCAAPGPASPSEFPVADWDRYVFIRRLGAGGMGEVFEARDLRLERVVALKFIRGGDPRLHLRLAQEARAQARIDHPNVCKVFEVGEVGGKAYIAMERVDGIPLGQLAEFLSLHDKVQIIRDVALALHEAHKLGILHRDVKPSNILVETLADGRLRAVVMDFGIARDDSGERGLTETGALLGTPAYMSPEQARGGGRELDRRSDVYSVGATLYELLAGRPPFDGDSVMTVVLAVLNDEPTRVRSLAPQVPQDLETIVAKCLNKDRVERYDSARALADDLDRYVAGEPILGRTEGLARRLRRQAKKHRALVVTAVLALGAASVAGGLALRARSVAREQAAALEIEAQTGRELGQDIKEMEWFLRAAHLLRLHDATRERAIVRERMRRIADQVPASASGAALVDYAVGRGHLALREDVQAYDRLSRAASAGLDTPELHYALGLVQGRLYQRALVDVRRGGVQTWIDRRTQEIEAQYLKPALASMERSRSVRLEAPSYLAGLVAFYRKDYDAALRLAQTARDEAPWLYEAVQLEAEIHLTRGVERKDRGESEDAARDLEAAARLFDAAADEGRSDAALYEGGAEARVRRMEMRVNAGGPPGDDYAAAVDRCAKAAAARPDRSEPYTELAYAHHFNWMYSSRGPGNEAREILTRELTAAQRALEIGGGDFATYERLAVANFSIAIDEMGHSGQPRLSIDEAIGDARRAIGVNPTHPWGHTALGSALGIRAQIKTAVGDDPAADFSEAIDESWKAIEADQGYAIGYANILQAYVGVAAWHADRGEDPAPATLRASDAFTSCVHANPRDPECSENAGGIDAWVAAYQVLSGSDPSEALARAQTQLDRSATLVETAENRQRLAFVDLLRTRDAIHRGGDPRPALAAMGETLDSCYRLAVADPVCSLLDARRQLLVADLDAKEPRKRPLLDRARVAARLAVDRDPREADTHHALAEVEQRLAALPGSPEDQARHRTAGLEACAQGLAVNPHHARLHAIRGALLLERARAASEGDRVAAAKAARASFREAFRLNPLLRREAGQAPDEADRLANGA